MNGRSRHEPTQNRDAERWLQSRGLPYFVVRGDRRALVVARTTPFLVLLVFGDLARWRLDTASLSLDSDHPEAGLALGVLTGLLLMVLAATPVAAFLTARALVRSTPNGMTALGAVLSTFYVTVSPWLAGHPFTGYPVWSTIVNLSAVVAALLATGFGIGSLVSWALRSAVRQLRALGQMTSRALPLLMLVVVVSFFSRTLWEVTSAMPASRLGGVVALFALLGLFFIVPVTRRETALLKNEGPSLSRLERFNITTVLVLAQAFQAAIFSVLVCVFLTVLGQISFSPSVLDAWLGPGRAPLEILGLRFPVDAALVKTTVFLSCVSSLNFLVSATTTAAYRSAFYEPLLDDAREALSVRSAYLLTGGREPR